MENSIEIPQKIKMKLPYNLETLLPGIHLKKPKTLIRKDEYTPVLIASIYTMTTKWKQFKCPPVDKWTKKWYICTVGYYSAIR